MELQQAMGGEEAVNEAKPCTEQEKKEMTKSVMR